MGCGTAAKVDSENVGRYMGPPQRKGIESVALAGIGPLRQKASLVLYGETLKSVNL